MMIVERFGKLVNWFVPARAKLERSERVLAQNFVFTHLFGPALSQSISVFLFKVDPDPGFACLTMIISICLFWVFPFYYKYTGNLRRAALMSVQLLAFTSLFGSYFYGGVSSPFLPWLIISLLLGFFYLFDKPWTVVCIFVVNLGGFTVAWYFWGFPDRLSHEQLSIVGWISILSATIYMAWMAIYYANMVSIRSELLLEVERHRETATRLEAAKDMADRANRAKSIFLAKMSHELRTPLNAMIGFSEILLDEIELESASSAKRADLERINLAAKHLLSLVTDVLDLSKIEANHIELKLEQFELSEMVQEIISSVKPMMLNKAIDLIVECRSDLGTVRTDKTKLRQAAINLLSNAAKFTEAGTITLSVMRRRHQAGDWIEIKVEDTGIGISPSEIGRLFENFEQANRSTARKFGGTGLGLALSQRLCGLMGGGISVTSIVEEGSCFTIRVLAWMKDQPQADESGADLACVGDKLVVA